MYRSEWMGKKVLLIGVVFLLGFITKSLLHKNISFEIKSVPMYSMTIIGHTVKISGTLHALNYSPVTSLILVDMICGDVSCDASFSVLNDGYMSIIKNSYVIESIRNGVIVASDDLSSCINKIVEIDTNAKTVFFKDTKKSAEQVCQDVPASEISEVGTFYPLLNRWKK